MTIIKRNGKQEEFKQYKIEEAIKKAFKSEGVNYDSKVFENVMAIAFSKETVSVEEIQDLIEKELHNLDYFNVMKSFMNYRLLHKMKREHILGLNEDTTYVNATQTIEEYVGKSDWRIQANSNTGYSNAGLINNTAGKVIANYWLDKVYSKEEGLAHRNGDYHIHDLDHLSGYCAGWSLRVLLDEGFNGVRSRVEARAPNHLKEALGQMANFLGILQAEWAGAQAFSSFDTYLAPYIFKDQLSQKEVKKAIVSFIYNLNVPARWGQSPFTNITIDWTVPNDLKDQVPTKLQQHLFKGINSEKLLKIAQERDPNIKSLEEMTYKHFQKEMNMINKAYYEVMTEGDKTGQPFTFPIPTVNITEDFDWYGENTDILFENTAKIGSSYFQNFIGSQFMRNEEGKLVENPEAYRPGHVRSMCILPDSEIVVKLNGSEKSEIRTIGNILDNYKLEDIQIRTSQGFRNIEEKFIYDVSEELIKITLDDGKTLTMTKEHPHLVYTGKNKLRIIKAELLQAGMRVSSKRTSYERNTEMSVETKDKISNTLKNKYKSGVLVAKKGIDSPTYGVTPPNAGIPCPNEVKEKISKTKKEGFASGKYILQTGEKNGMFGKTHTIEARKKISYLLKNHKVTKNCRQKSAERWTGLNNPVAFQKHWDKKTFTYNNGEISPSEKIIFDELESLDINFKHQKVFTDFVNKKTYVADFFIPEKNTVIELESQCDEKVYINERHFSLDKNKFDFYISHGINVIIFNAEKCNTYRTHINKTQTIVKVEKVNYSGKVYDVRIKQKNGSHPVNDFFANDILTHNCCRLQLDLRELLKRGGGLFGSAEMTGCYTADTEILTERGWIFFKDLTGAEKVLTMNSNKNPSWEYIEKKHEYGINDNIYRFGKNGISELSVTPNHRMIVSNNKNSFEIKRADEVFKNNEKYFIPKSLPIKGSDIEVVINNQKVDSKFFYKLIGIILQDNNYQVNDNNIVFGRGFNENHYASVCNLLNVLDIVYKYNSNNGEFTINEEGFVVYFKNLNGSIPKELFGCSAEIISSFYEGMKISVHHTQNNSFYAINEDFKNDLQQLLILLGKTSKISISLELNEDLDYFKVIENEDSVFNKEDLIIEKYEGMVYCVTVPNNTVCVRHNGAVNWSGNSLGVVTINMARLGYLYKDEEKLVKELDILLDLAKSTLEKKRIFVQEMYDRGLYPYTARYLPGFRNHFSTIGVNGINEMIRNFTEDQSNITTKEGKELAIKILNYIRNKMVQYQEETGNLYNLEATPAEGTTYRFAKEDKKRYPDIIQAGFGDNIYYTNSSQVPANFTDDPFEALELQDDLQCKYTGGTVLHLYMRERLSSAEACRKLVKNVISNHRLPYITVTPVFSVCEKHGYLAGEHEYCPKCDEELLLQNKNLTIE